MSFGTVFEDAVVFVDPLVLYRKRARACKPPVDNLDVEVVEFFELFARTSQAAIGGRLVIILVTAGGCVISVS